MQVEIKQLDMVTKEITIVVDAETANKDYKEFLKDNAKEIQIQGFRRGKAPLSMVERIYGPKMKEYFIKDSIDLYFGEVMLNHQLAYFVTPYVKKANWDVDKEFELLIEIEHEPELEIEIPETFEVEYVEESLEDKVYNIISQAATRNYRILDVEIAEEMDLILCELEFQLGEQQIVSNAAFYASEHSDNQGLAELSGKSVGDILTVNLTGSTILLASEGNKPAVDKNTEYACKIMINSISRYSVPDVNDDFAKDMDFDSLEDMKQKIGEETRLFHEQQNMIHENDAILMNFYKKHQFPFPKRAIQYFAEKDVEGTQKPDIREMMKNQATIQVMQTMLKHFIAKALKKAIQPSLSEEDVERFMEHNAIIDNIPLEAWKDKNKDIVSSTDFQEEALIWTMLRKLAEKAIFIEPDTVDSISKDAEYTADEIQEPTEE